MSPSTPVGEQLLSLDEWVAEVPPAALGIPGKYAIRVTKLDAVSEALTLPILRIGDRPLYADLPAKTAAIMARLLRARVVHYGNAEVAVATAVRYLARNGAALALSEVQAAKLAELAQGVAGGSCNETQLASFLSRFVTAAERAGPERSEPVLLYVSIPSAAGDQAHRQHLYQRIEDTALDVAPTLSTPIDLATTSPGLLKREPDADWGARRGALVRGDRDVLSPERSRPASGMIAIAIDGGGIELGLELAMIGERGPVLLLHPPEAKLPDALLGYARRDANIHPVPFHNEAEICAHVAAFIRAKCVPMAVLGRQRRDAGISCTPLQLRLRRRLATMGDAGLDRLVAATNFAPSYIVELITEPLAYARAELCDVFLLANELGEPFEDHVTRAEAPQLTNRQLEAWLCASRRRGLSIERTLELRERGEELLVRAHGRATLSESENWEALLTPEVSQVA